jgi:hypothetical protein
MSTCWQNDDAIIFFIAMAIKTRHRTSARLSSVVLAATLLVVVSAESHRDFRIMDRMDGSKTLAGWDCSSSGGD